MDDRLKQLASLLIIFCLAGCTGNPNKSTEHVNYGTVVLNDTPTQTNTTVSNYEIALARLQNIPLLDLGTDYKKALKTLKNYRLTVIKESGDAIEVKAYKKQKIGAVSVSLAETNVFIYQFEQGKLISGPNIISK